MRPVVIALWTGDVAFILLHALSRSGIGVSPLPAFSIEQEFGAAEVFQYLKLVTLAALMTRLFARERCWTFAGWAVLFLYLLLDDAFTVHERGGVFLARLIGFRPILGLPSQPLGELVVFAAVGTGFAALFVLLARNDRRRGAAVNGSLLLCLLALTVCGVMVDLVHAIYKTSIVAPLLTVIEDGGEMVLMSVTLAYVSAVARQSIPRDVPIWKLSKEPLSAGARPVDLPPSSVRLANSITK